MGRLRTCVVCGVISDQARCPDHRVERPSFRERGYSSRHDQLRARLIREARQAGGCLCGMCGDPVNLSVDGNHRDGPVLDHVVPRSHGGPSGVRENARLVHRRCSDSQGGQLAQEVGRGTDGATRTRRPNEYPREKFPNAEREVPTVGTKRAPRFGSAGLR